MLGALEEARAAGATTVAVVVASRLGARALADHEIVVVVGPEVIAGSTRLKAGTAQKLVAQHDLDHRDDPARARPTAT